MRAVGIVVLVTLGVCSLEGLAQRPLPTQGQEALEAKARESADLVAAAAKNRLGNLHPSGQLAFRKWIVAVTRWNKESNSSPASLLAEGVLFDCLTRLAGLHTGFSFGIAVDPRFNELGSPDRLGRAVDLFERALKGDDSLLEARFRRARIRAHDDQRAAEELEGIAASGVDPEVSYLAAVSRASVAHAARDTPTAVRWFQRALGLHPGSTAAAVGLSILQPGYRIAFDALGPADPFYSYPCRVLTPSVGADLHQRISAVILR